MSPETVTTTITRPNIFPECHTCPIVINLINSWLTYGPPHSFITSETEKISISCMVNEQDVLLLHEVLINIQFTTKGKVLSIPGGNSQPEPVSCPHFHYK